MKTLLITGLLLGFSCPMFAQSTTGGQSGGSTASTGSGYESSGRRPGSSRPSSMTVNDEGSARNYMYVPPSQAKVGDKPTHVINGKDRDKQPAPAKNRSKNPTQQ